MASIEWFEISTDLEPFGYREYGERVIFLVKKPQEGPFINL
jgi:hypothetical protein